MKRFRCQRFRVQDVFYMGLKLIRMKEVVTVIYSENYECLAFMVIAQKDNHFLKSLKGT